MFWWLSSRASSKSFSEALLRSWRADKIGFRKPLVTDFRPATRAFNGERNGLKQYFCFNSLSEAFYRIILFVAEPHFGYAAKESHHDIDVSGAL